VPADGLPLAVGVGGQVDGGGAVGGGLELVQDLLAGGQDRSRTWPMEAFTWKSRPRYLLMVLALAGDSTMTRFFATLF
jgi:hypothetical protein